MTKQELLDYKGNLSVLSPEQRKIRRVALQQKRNKNPMSQVAKARRQSRKETYGKVDVPGKGNIADYGECCRDNCTEPRLPGTDLCAGHQPKLSYKRLKAPEMMREAVEVAVAEFLRPYFAALGVEFVGYDTETNLPVVKRLPGVAGKGIVLHGESKEGIIKMTDIPNLTAQVAIVEKLLDRVYGRARTTTVLEGGSRPIKVQPVKSVQRAQQVADLLARSHALPDHEGRQRRDPGVVEGEETVASEESDDAS